MIVDSFLPIKFVGIYRINFVKICRCGLRDKFLLRIYSNPKSFVAIFKTAILALTGFQAAHLLQL
ncbi:MAG TPA: hypothetical protein DDW51_20805, partial [Cyanobacteria bacterium UBA11367]|nr:hypothetical protein [Cyanobacteria bacterium UBA11367]